MSVIGKKTLKQLCLANADIGWCFVLYLKTHDWSFLSSPDFTRHPVKQIHHLHVTNIAIRCIGLVYSNMFLIVCKGFALDEWFSLNNYFYIFNYLSIFPDIKSECSAEFLNVTTKWNATTQNFTDFVQPF